MVSTTAAVATVITCIYTPMHFQSFVGYAQHMNTVQFLVTKISIRHHHAFEFSRTIKNCSDKDLLSFLNASYLPNTVAFSDFKDQSSNKFRRKWKVASFCGDLNILWVDLWKSLYMTCIHDWKTEWLIDWVNMVFNYKQPPPSYRSLGETDLTSFLYSLRSKHLTKP